MSQSQLSRLSDQVPEIKRLQERVVELEGLLATCEARAYEAAAKVCEQLQQEKDARVSDDAWRTLGTTEISGQAFAAAIRALSPAPVEPKGPRHVCGLTGYNPMIDPICPACAE